MNKVDHYGHAMKTRVIKIALLQLRALFWFCCDRQSRNCGRYLSDNGVLEWCWNVKWSSDNDFILLLWLLHIYRAAFEKLGYDSEVVHIIIQSFTWSSNFATDIFRCSCDKRRRERRWNRLICCLCDNVNCCLYRVVWNSGWTFVKIFVFLRTH